MDTREEHRMSLATKRVNVLDGMVPSPKVLKAINPAKVSNLQLWKQFRKANPMLRDEDYVSHFKGVSPEIIEKVREGFKCLIEIYHLYGLKRPVSVPKFSEYQLNKNYDKGVLLEAYFDKYVDDLIYNRKYGIKIEMAITKLLCYLIETNDESLWVSYFKYKTCAFFASHEGQEIPPAPGGLIDKPHVIFFGEWVNHFRRSSIKNGGKMWKSFLMSINQAKMGMPRSTKDAILEAEMKCALHLTTEPPPLVDRIIMNRRPIVGDRSLLTPEDLDFHELDRVVVNKENMCVQLRRTVREMFKSALYLDSTHYEPFFPSTSSNYNRTRGEMGAVGTVMEMIWDDPELNTLYQTEMIKLDVCPVSFREELSRRYGDVGRLEQEQFDACTEHEVSGKAICFSDEDFRMIWRRFMDKLFQAAYIEDPKVEPLGLLEALKIRVISKGPPLLYTYLKPFQKFMWSTLKRNKVFTLIGTPITPDLINKIIGRMSDGVIVINGDYKASTDNLHSWVSECLANELVDTLNENGRNAPNEEYFHINEQFREMLLRSLIHHKFEINGEWIEQKEGQLMGSISSFPFLCLANACFCRWALELADKKTYRLLDNDPSLGPRAPLLINGDDCTLRGDRRFLRDNWEKITSFGGLTSSVGKTFYSLPNRPICMINSVAFDYDFDSQLWEERKYVNMGILLGKKRSVGKCEKGDGSVSYGALGELHRELHRQSPPEIWTSVASRFVYYNANVLKKYPNIPWSMPEYLGGPGLVPCQPYSELDLRCATLLKMNMSGRGEFHNNRLAVRKVETIMEWKLHQLVRDRLKQFEPIVGREAPFRTLRNFNSFEYGLREIEEINLFDDFLEDMNELCPFVSLEDTHSRLYKSIVVESLFDGSWDHIFNKDMSTRSWSLVNKASRKKKFSKDKERLPSLFTLNGLQFNCWSNEQFVEEYTRKRNDMSWANVRKDAFNVQSMVIMQQHEVAHEKKDFVIPVAPYSLYRELKEFIHEIS